MKALGILLVMFLLLWVEGGETAPEDQEKWDEKYSTQEYIYGKEPVKFLEEYLHLLPKGGRALDLAMGEGRSAVFLAQKGFEVEGVDISGVAIKKAQALAEEKGVKIKAIQADLEDYSIKKSHYDLIACFYYLQRDLIPQMKEGLKKGGMVIYETYTLEQAEYGHPKNPQYLLGPNELLHLFDDFHVIFYREMVLDNTKAVASLIAQKVK